MIYDLVRITNSMVRAPFDTATANQRATDPEPYLKGLEKGLGRVRRVSSSPPPIFCDIHAYPPATSKRHGRPLDPHHPHCGLE